MWLEEVACQLRRTVNDTAKKYTVPDTAGQGEEDDLEFRISGLGV